MESIIKRISFTLLLFIIASSCNKDPRADEYLAPSDLVITSISNITETTADISYSYKKNSKYYDTTGDGIEDFWTSVLFSDGSEAIIGGKVGGRNTITIYSLKAGTSYEVRIRLTPQYGGAVTSQPVTFTTKKSSK